MTARPAESHVDPARLCRLLGDWSEAGRTLPEALARSIAELVEASVLPDGATLPSQRALADALGVARVTVAQAYDLLAANDVLTARRGSGSRVRGRHAPAALGASNAVDGRLASHTGHVDRAIDLTSGALPGLPMVADEVAALDVAALRPMIADDGYHPAGLPELRSAIAARYTAGGLATRPDEVLVTGGAQQAVWLIAHTLVSSGDDVIVEEPTYRGTLEAFRACGARLVPVPVGPHGLDVDHLARVLARRQPRLLYVQPVAHNPTGRTMPDHERRRLAALVEQHGLLTIDDASAADVLLERPAGVPWASLVPTALTLTVGTASKLLWGGLRVGWIRGSASAISRLAEARKAVDLSGSAVDQLVTARLLPRAEEARAERRAFLTEALERSSRVIREVHPTWTWTPPSGGTGLWIDTGTDAVALAERGMRHGVRVVPGPTSSAVDGFGTYLRLPYWHAEDELREGLTRLR